MKVYRRIVQINEEKCNGCGLCIPACHEGAIEIIDGKARLLAEKLCDGIGDCLGECPLGAIEIIEREADDFDEDAVKERLKELAQKDAPKATAGGCPSARPQFFGGCPGSMARTFDQEEVQEEKVELKSALRQWPVQLTLVPVNAPYFQNAELLLAADCVPFAYANFHQELLQGKAVAIACPKLDNVNPYVHKLAEIIKANNLKGITIARMEVPCCGGLAMIVREAIKLAGIDVKVTEKVVGVRGNLVR